MMAATPQNAVPFGLAAANAVKATLSRRTRMLLERGDSPRSGEKVWRNSYTEGTIENRVWKPIHDGTARGGKRWTGALLKAARALEYRTRRERREVKPGVRNGKLGEVGLEVLAFLYETVDFASGRLEPAIATIAEGVGRSYSAVHDALCRLRREGFLYWMRRSRPIDDPEPGGPQVEQVPNAYALLVPEPVKDWMHALFRRTPIPGCEEDRRRHEAEAYEAMLNGLSTQERHTATWNGDSLLGETLRRLAAAVNSRLFQKGESGTTRETGGSY
ncbi:MAG: hypothetical protein QM676_14630 [Novosphingobium sp.]